MKYALALSALAVALFAGLTQTSNAQILTNEYHGYTGTPVLPIPANGYSSKANLTNSPGSIWSLAPAGATSVTFTDISGQTNVVLRMIAYRKSDLMAWQGTNSISCTVLAGTNYFQLNDYVVVGSVPAGTELKWRAVWY